MGRAFVLVLSENKQPVLSSTTNILPLGVKPSNRPFEFTKLIFLIEPDKMIWFTNTIYNEKII